MFVAAMLSAAVVTDNVITIINTGLGQIPENCRLAEAVHDVLIWHKNNVDAEEAIKRIHQKYDESTLGSILGMILGADLIPGKWELPLNDRIISAVTNFQDSKISELAKSTVDLVLTN